MMAESVKTREHLDALVEEYVNVERSKKVVKEVEFYQGIAENGTKGAFRRSIIVPGTGHFILGRWLEGFCFLFLEIIESVIVLDVLAGSRCPYYLKAEGDKDGVYVRVGATTQRADDATRHELALEAEGRSFDSEPCPNAKITDARIAALCSNMYRIARRNARDESERKAVRKITANQLQAWGIISRSRNRWIASNADALLTGDRAFATRVKCGVFKGDSKAVFVDRREFTGPIYEQIEETISNMTRRSSSPCTTRAWRSRRLEACRAGSRSRRCLRGGRRSATTRLPRPSTT